MTDDIFGESDSPGLLLADVLLPAVLVRNTPEEHSCERTNSIQARISSRKAKVARAGPERYQWNPSTCEGVLAPRRSSGSTSGLSNPDSERDNLMSKKKLRLRKMISHTPIDTAQERMRRSSVQLATIQVSLKRIPTPVPQLLRIGTDGVCRAQVPGRTLRCGAYGR